VGTARYAAPEQALGQRVDGRADVYALALVLYESVTGVVPFAADTTAATLMARVGTALPDDDRLGALADVLTAAAAPEAAGRLDASSLARRLADLEDELAPADPLPLAGTRPLDGPGGARAVDRTEHGMLAPAVVGEAAALRGGPDAVAVPDPTHAPPTDAYALAHAVGVTTGPGTSGGRTGRRWPWVVTVVVLVCALAGVAGAYAAARTKLFTPSHRLTSLSGMTPQEASAALRSDRLTVRVVRRRSSLAVAKGHILRQIPGAGTMLKEGSTVSVVVSTGPPSVTVPPLGALTGDCPSVLSTLTAAHLKADCTHANSTTVAQGTVISWTPRGSAPEYSTIRVTVSSGPPIETIPSLSGSTCPGATTALQAVGLVAQCTNHYSTSVPSGQVISWSPTGTARQGTTVTVVVSEGPPPVTVPDVTGDSVAQAISQLEEVGLVPGTDQGPLVGHVFETNPAAGTSVAEGTTVTLYTK